MGVVLLKAGAYTKAEEQYRAILKVSPDDVEAQVGLAAALRGEADAQHPQKLDEARGLLEKALAAESARRRARSSTWESSTPTFSSDQRDAGPLFKRFLSDAPSDHPLRAEAEKYVSASAANAPPPPPPPPAAPGVQKPAPPPPKK